MILKEELHNISTLFKDETRSLKHSINITLQNIDLSAVSEILIVGSGEYLALGLSTKHIFELLTGIPTREINTIEASCYFDINLFENPDYNPLFIFVNNQASEPEIMGGIERIASYQQAYILQILDDEKRMNLNMPNISYITSQKAFAEKSVLFYSFGLYTLLLSAVIFGERMSRYTQLEYADYILDIQNFILKLTEWQSVIDDELRMIAEKHKDKKVYNFIGAGFDFGAVWFGSTKLTQETGLLAINSNSEDWLKINNIERNKQEVFSIFVLNSTNPAWERGLKALEVTKDANQPLLLITDKKIVLDKENIYQIVVPEVSYKFNMILGQYIPIILFISYLRDVM